MSSMDHGELPLPSGGRGRPAGRQSPLMAVVALCQPGGISMIATPALLSAFAASGRFPSSACATFGSAELAGMTIAILATTLVFGRIDRRRFALSALCVAICGHLLTIPAAARGEYAVVLLARLLAGLGEGGMTGVAVAAIAGLPAPDRAFGLAIPGNLIGSSVIFALMPSVMAAGGLPVLLMAVTGYSVVFGLMIPRLPGGPVIGAPAPSPLWTSERREGGSKLPGLVALGGTLIFLTGIGAVWPMAAEIGQAMGAGGGTVATALSAAGLAGAAAGVMAGWLGARFRRLPLLVGGTLGAAVAMLLFAAPLGVSGFAASTVGLMVCWVFSITFYFGTLAAMDRSGRLVGASAALQAFGLGSGQVLAASLGHARGFVAVTGAGAALVATAALLLIAAASLFRRTSGPRSQVSGGR